MVLALRQMLEWTAYNRRSLESMLKPLRPSGSEVLKDGKSWLPKVACLCLFYLAMLSLPYRRYFTSTATGNLYFQLRKLPGPESWYKRMILPGAGSAPEQAGEGRPAPHARRQSFPALSW